MGRCHALDGLRGIAALVVVNYHAVTAVAGDDPVEVGARLLLNGSGAVALFFVLSGFVLALGLRSGTPTWPGYAAYLVRRAFRLLPLLAVSTLCGAALTMVLAPLGAPPQASAWFSQFYQQPVDPARVLAALVGYSAAFDPPVWSIYVEIIGSALMPVFVVALAQRGIGWMAAAILAALALAPLSTKYSWHVFLINFYLGASILLWGRSLARQVAALPPTAFWALNAGLIGTFLLFRGLAGPFEHGSWAVNAVEMAAVAPILAMIYGLPERYTVLTSRPIQALGRVSFSLYLLHFLVLAGLFAAVSRAAPHLSGTGLAVVLAVATSVLSIGVAHLAFRFVEEPGQRVGRRIAALASRASASGTVRPARDRMAMVHPLDAPGQSSVSVPGRTPGF
jgi:peptidoglycan/LPS O-acetylase OafA/YrhL